MAAKSNSAVPLLALILAIPAVACYVWWTHLNSETKRQLSLRVRNRTDGVQFGAVSDRDRLSNPMAAAVSASTGSARPAAAAPFSAAASSRPAAGLPAAAQPPAGASGPVSAAAQPPASPSAAAPGALSAAAAPVVITRDPMLSPFDIVRLQQMEYEKEQARLELERARSSRGRKRSEPSVESRIELEGIVSGQRGNRAIINGETVAAGDVVLGAKVVRITAQSVVFAYKSRRFTKSISK